MGGRPHQVNGLVRLRLGAPSSSRQPPSQHFLRERLSLRVSIDSLAINHRAPSLHRRLRCTSLPAPECSYSRSSAEPRPTQLDLRCTWHTSRSCSWEGLDWQSSQASFLPPILLRPSSLVCSASITHYSEYLRRCRDAVSSRKPVGGPTNRQAARQLRRSSSRVVRGQEVLQSSAGSGRA